jgi:LysM repeat protein
VSHGQGATESLKLMQPSERSRPDSIPADDDEARGEPAQASPSASVANLSAAGCPWLSLNEDPAVQRALPNADHRCHAQPGLSITPSPGYQMYHCLTSNAYETCPLFVPPPPRATAVPLGESGISSGVPGGYSRLRWAALAAVAAVVAVIGFRLGFSGADDGATAVASTPTTTVTAGVAATAESADTVASNGDIEEPAGAAGGLGGPTSTATTVAEQEPQDAVGATNDGEASVTPEAAESTPTPQPDEVELKTYVVRAGDTAALIADREGISIAALLEANGKTIDDFILIGEVLVIPAPPE